MILALSYFYLQMVPHGTYLVWVQFNFALFLQETLNVHMNVAFGLKGLINNIDP